MDPNRKFWNQQQKELRHALERGEDYREATEVFLSQHAMVHSANMSQAGLWSFEDEIWQYLTEETTRRIPKNCHHSIAWNIWHLARIEDVTMNLLVADSPQCLYQENWNERMKITDLHTGNGMSDEEIVTFSATVDIEALRAYRITVGRRTREIVQQLQPEDFKRKVEASRLQHIRDEGAMRESAEGILEYWGKRTIAGLLLMPPTRHNFLHLNEALRLKQRRK